MASLKTPTLPPATATNTLIVENKNFFVVEPATHEKDKMQHLFDKTDEMIGESKQFGAILFNPLPHGSRRSGKCCQSTL